MKIPNKLHVHTENFSTKFTPLADRWVGVFDFPFLTSTRKYCINTYMCLVEIFGIDQQPEVKIVQCYILFFLPKMLLQTFDGAVVYRIF